MRLKTKRKSVQYTPYTNYQVQIKRKNTLLVQLKEIKQRYRTKKKKSKILKGNINTLISKRREIERLVSKIKEFLL